MSNESKEDRHRAAMQKALSTSMLIHFSEEEMLSLSDSWQKNQGCSFGPSCPCRTGKPSSRQPPPTEER
jgi:hypothetical protein